MVRLNLWQSLLKRESFERGLEFKEGGDIPQTGRQRIPHRWSKGTERTVANGFETLFRDFHNFLVRRSEGARSLIRAEIN